MLPDVRLTRRGRVLVTVIRLAVTATVIAKLEMRADDEDEPGEQPNAGRGSGRFTGVPKRPADESTHSRAEDYVGEEVELRVAVGGQVSEAFGVALLHTASLGPDLADAMRLAHAMSGSVDRPTGGISVRIAPVSNSLRPPASPLDPRP